MQPVDEATAALVIAALQRARARCISPVLALDQAGLLMTESLARGIRRDTLINTAEAVRNTRVRALREEGLIPRDPTPAVLLKVVADRLEFLAVQAERGDFR